MTRPLALLFGGSRGIGAAAVQSLARDGFDVAYTYATAAAAAADIAGATIRGYRCDVRDAQAVAGVFDGAARDFARPVDCAVANAGISLAPGPIAQYDAQAFREMVEVNVIGAFNVLQQAARSVADGGSIIALTTTLVRHAAPGMGTYAATKGAVECLVRSLAREIAPRRVRVNAVAPGPVDTDLFRAGKNEEAIARSASLSPFNRIGKPEEIGAVIAFLASSRASWVSGQIVQPNGGLI